MGRAAPLRLVEGLARAARREIPARNRVRRTNLARHAAEEHYKYIPEAPGLILNLVAEHPEYTNTEISRVLEETNGSHIIGPSAVHRFIQSMQLSTYEQRVAYAQIQAVPVPEAAYQPEWKLPAAIGAVFLSIFILFVSVIAQGTSLINRVGLFFSLSPGGQTRKNGRSGGVCPEGEKRPR